MQGWSFKCDNCGRIAFIPEDEVVVVHKPEGDEELFFPPAGWLGVSSVPLDGKSWEKAKHYCVLQCLHDGSGKLLNEAENVVMEVMEWDDDEDIAIDGHD